MDDKNWEQAMEAWVVLITVPTSLALLTPERQEEGE
jgi:hypothetical protein